MIIWMLQTLSEDGRTLTVDGLFADKAAAMEKLTDDNQGVVPMEIGKDYAETEEFFIRTKAYPNGIRIYAEDGQTRRSVCN